MELLKNLSDDELAVAGCLGALVLSFGLISGSYHLSRIFRARRVESGLPGLSGIRPAGSDENRSSSRRAA